jgi:LytS/YehU family sensor histidine kinase
LKALHSQINPHFLFNALNTLYGTIDRRSQTARRFVLNLAEIFRYFLQTERTLIPLEEELEIVRAYLEIEQMRLGERLETCLSVPDGARRALIPALSIQPLVENAVKHGIASKQGKGMVTLTVTEGPGGLTVKIQDTGDGFKNKAGEPGAGNGIGLENVRQRLRLYYGEGEGLKIASDANGTMVSFFVPAPEGLDGSRGIRRSLADSVHRR